MTIWKIINDYDNYAPLVFSHNVTLEQMRSFNGTSLEPSWSANTIAVECGDSELDMGNCGCILPHVLYADAKSSEVFKDFKGVELLPVEFNGEKIYIVNVLNVVDPIDNDKSKTVFLKNTNKILTFSKLVIKEEESMPDIFKLERLLYNGIYVSENTKKCIEDNGIKGLLFEAV